MVLNAMKYVMVLTYSGLNARGENHETCKVTFIKRRLADER